MPIRYRRFAPSISYVDIEGIRYRRSHFSISKVTSFDIDGDKPSISKVMNTVVDIEVTYLRYRIYIDRYRMLISYMISKVFLTFDFEGYVIKYRGRYRIRYSIHPMSFTAERKLPLPRLHHAGAEESQRHKPWITAPSFCGIPQLDPQRFDEERSFHIATTTPHPYVDFDSIFEKPAPSPAVRS
jgi:hypothetical protein